MRNCIRFSTMRTASVVGVDLHVGRARGDRLACAACNRPPPNTDDLGLDKAGVKTDERGYIEVDDSLRTNVPHIFAWATATAAAPSRTRPITTSRSVAANLIDDDPRRVSDRIQTYALYIDPPLGRGRHDRNEARKKGHKLLIGERAP